MKKSSRMSQNVLLMAPLALAFALGAAASLHVTVARADDASCGSKENPCPLQKWMRQNMAPALAAGDNAGLAASFDKVAANAPDASWSTWSQFAKQGSNAAKKGDTAGAKAACKSCHDAYKDKYKAQYRTKAPPK
ncbi:MAG: hypothetical protein ACRELY_18790 [Polyangiaceae bacterium]